MLDDQQNRGSHLSSLSWPWKDRDTMVSTLCDLVLGFLIAKLLDALNMSPVFIVVALIVFFIWRIAHKQIFAIRTRTIVACTVSLIVLASTFYLTYEPAGRIPERTAGSLQELQALHRELIDDAEQFNYFYFLIARRWGDVRAAILSSERFTDERVAEAYDEYVDMLSILVNLAGDKPQYGEYEFLSSERDIDFLPEDEQITNAQLQASYRSIRAEYDNVIIEIRRLTASIDDQIEFINKRIESYLGAD